MKKTEYIINKMQDVKIKDIISVFSFVIAKLISPFAWKRYKGCWLICEDPKEARDNGYCLYQRKSPGNSQCLRNIKKVI